MNHSGFLSHIREKASHLAFGNVLYNWSLGRGSAHVHAFAARPVDVWPGSADRGRWLCSGVFPVDETAAGAHENFWENPEADASWVSYMHGFAWLRDLKALGGDMARLQARGMIESWIRHYGVCCPVAWQPDYAGCRIANWITFFDFFGESADEVFQERFFTSLSRQARHLSRAAQGVSPGLPAFYVARGLAYAGIALEGRESWLAQALDILQEEGSRQILPDGGHISRNAEKLLETLRVFIDIRAALRTGGYPVPVALEHTVDRMAQALRFFRYADKHFAVFHGAQEGDAAFIDAVLARSNARGKVLCGLPQSGFERLILGRSQIMMDCGAPPPYPYDKGTHASPLAFEFIYGRERIFVSCGAHPFDPDWQDSLRATAAHNSLSLDHRNACEIRADRHMGRKCRKITVNRQDSFDAILIEATHDGYVPLNGITHRRRLYLGQNGHDLRGEDNLTCSIGLQKPVDVMLRFHLHPRVLVSLIQDGHSALLLLPGGAGWRFSHNGGRLSLENGIYLGEGERPRKTKQLVLHGTMENDCAQIKWALQRETK